MGWKGTLRSFNSIARQASIESTRRKKAAERYRYAARQEALRQDSQALVEEHNSYLSFITSFHKECPDPIDWKELLNTPEPLKPILTNQYGKKAKEDYINFKPSIFNKILGNSETAQENLRLKIAKATEDDKKKYEEDLKLHNESLLKLNEDRDKARLIIANDIDAIKKVLDEIDPFSDLNELSISINLLSCKPNGWKVDVIITDTKFIRGYEMRMLRNGQATSKDMSKANLNLLLEDVFSSISIRIARVFFALFPIKFLVVNSYSVSINTSNGRKEPLLSLSCLYKKEGFENINFDNVDPSEYIKFNTKSNSGFKKDYVTLAKDVTDIVDR